MFRFVGFFWYGRAGQPLAAGALRLLMLLAAAAVEAS